MRQPIVVANWQLHADPVQMLAALPVAQYRFLLESQGGPADIARYSFLGHRPFEVLRSVGKQISHWRNGDMRQWEGDPLLAMQEALDRVRVEVPPGMWPPLVGGAVGYFAYDLGRQIETLPNTALNDLGLPELALAFYDHLIAIDHQTNQVFVIALPLRGREQQAINSARQLAERARRAPLLPEVRPAQNVGRLASNFTRHSYACAVEKVLAHIAAGDIYQANLSQRFSAPLHDDGFSLYRRLRQINPAPFAAYLGYGDFEVVSASPERFLQYKPNTGRIETRPIKGTRRRGANSADDERLKNELIDSEKDAAELVMIVDLERNDLGRVCRYGSVHVPELRRIEAYPTVWHTVAVVEGIVRAGATTADILRATFPGGSITGAPKIRAMQIIESLENLRRHVYCGAIGYLSASGEFDLNIAIRTITVKDRVAYFNAGGGIVADSSPEDEYDETLHKARAMANALGYTSLEV